MKNLKLLLISAFCLSASSIVAANKPPMLGATVSDQYYSCESSYNVKKADNRCTRLPGKNNKVVVCKYRAGTRPPFVGVKACKPIKKPVIAKKAPAKKIVTPTKLEAINSGATKSIQQPTVLSGDPVPVLGAGPTTTMSFVCDANVDITDSRCRRPFFDPRIVECEYKIGTTPPLLDLQGCVNSEDFKEQLSGELPPGALY